MDGGKRRVLKALRGRIFGCAGIFRRLRGLDTLLLRESSNMCGGNDEAVGVAALDRHPDGGGEYHRLWGKMTVPEDVALENVWGRISGWRGGITGSHGVAVLLHKMKN